MLRRNGRRDSPASRTETIDGDSNHATASRCTRNIRDDSLASRPEISSPLLARHSRLVRRLCLRALLERDTAATSARLTFDSRKILRRATRSAILASKSLLLIRACRSLARFTLTDIQSACFFLRVFPRSGGSLGGCTTL